MGDDGWFEATGELGDAERTFAAVLRGRAAAWPEDPASSQIDPYGHGCPVIAWLDLSAPDANSAFLTVGLHFQGDRIRGDQLHNQNFTLPDQPTSMAMEATGTPQQLADSAADWFEAILRRPIIRHEWLRFGQKFADEHLFGDNGDRLCWSYNQDRAPLWHRFPFSRHRAPGCPVDRLGPPHRIIDVRGVVTGGSRQVAP